VRPMVGQGNSVSTGYENKVRLPGGSRRGGFTLTEITIAVALFATMAGALVYSMTRAKSLSWTSRERATALEAAQSVMEDVRATQFDQAFAVFSANPDFPVPGLTVRQGDPDGFAGEVLFPGDGVTLREDVQDRDWGMPRDLNLDYGVIDANDHSMDYQVLPVRVRVAWRGPAGDQQVEIVSLLVE